MFCYVWPWTFALLAVASKRLQTSLKGILVVLGHLNIKNHNQKARSFRHRPAYALLFVITYR
eukprot:6209109-Pleurochrysis_carterae.AAC.3